MFKFNKQKSKKENTKMFNNNLSGIAEECKTSLQELIERYEMLFTIFNFFQDNFQLFCDKDSEILKVFALGSNGIQLITDIYHIAADLEEEFKYRVLLDNDTKATICSRPYHKTIKETLFNVEYIRGLITDNKNLTLSSANTILELEFDELNKDLFKLRQKCMKNGILNDTDGLLIQFLNSVCNCFDLKIISFDRHKESCQNITITTSLLEKTIIYYHKENYNENFLSETKLLETYVAKLSNFDKAKQITLKNKETLTTTVANLNFENTETANNTEINSALKKKNTSSTKKSVKFSDDNNLQKKVLTEEEMDEINRKQKKNEKSLMQIYPDFNSFLFAFGFGDYKEKNTPTLFSLINLNYEIPCQILESFYNKYKFSPISSTTFMDEKVSLVALTKLEPKTWLSDITIDAFYYLLNKYEKVKNIPAEESAYFVDSVFMHGPHSEILYNTVQNLNLKNIEDKENISAIESTINVWFELFNKKGSKTVYNILKKIVLKKLNYKYMVFPTVVGKDHFSVIVLEKETDLSDETRVVYSIRNFDSLPSNRIDKQIIEFTKLKSVEMFFNKLHKECNPYLDVSFEIINADIQTQFNGYDCGIFTCMKAMEYFEKKRKNIRPS